MATYSYAQLEGIWLKAAQGTRYATQAWASLMAAIGLAESSGRSDATNPTDNNGTQTSWGIWQISLGNHTPPAPNWDDPYENARLAIGKLNTQGITAWGTYDTGAYKRYYKGPGGLPPDLNPPASTPGAPPGDGKQPATLTGFNPLQWTEAPLKGLEWAGKFITGFAPNKFASGLGELGNIASGVTKLVGTLNKLAALFALLFRPSFWLRVLAGIVGLLSLGGAIYFLGKTL